jgi:hypothetical protein
MTEILRQPISMDKKPIVKTKTSNKQKVGLLVLMVGCAILLRRDSSSAQKDTYSSTSKDA